MLNQILEATRARLERDGIAAGGEGPQRRGLAEALARPGLQVIAEIKRRSPSAGDLAPNLNPAAQARSYELGGAAGISVLTEPEYFGGSLDDLRLVRDTVSLPILRKDFIIDPRQVAESRAAGADALLLIVAALDPGLLREFLEECDVVGIEALVEAHDAAEAGVAAAAGARILGVNNRNLRTFQTDLGVAEAVAPSLPAGTVLIAESGVSTPDGARRMAAAGYHAILVGEALVTSHEPARVIAALRSAAS